MKQQHLFLLFSAVALALSVVHVTAEDEVTPPTPAKLPEILISKKQTWDAENGVQWCNNGLMGAVAASLSVPSDLLDGLMGMLGGVGGAGKSSSVSRSSGFSEVNLPAVRPLTEAEYLDSIKASFQSRSNTKDAASLSKALAYARTDYALSKQLLGDSSANLANVLMGSGLLPQLVPAVQEALMQQIALNQSSSVDSPEGRGLDLPPLPVESMMKSMEMTLLLLTSKTFTTFLGNLIGPGTGKHIKDPSLLGMVLGGFTPEAGMISPMVNLLDAYCMAQEYAMVNDVMPEKPVCSIVNVVSSALACREDSWSTSSCNPDLPTYLPLNDKNDTVCVVQKGDRKGEEINLDGSEAIVLDFKNLIPLPDTIDPVDNEGVATFFLFRSTTIVMTYASSLYFCGNPMPAEELMPGWETSHVISYMPEGSPKQAQTKVPDYPIALIGSPTNPNQQNECQRVLSFRGTGSQFEWGVDLDTMFVPFIKEGIQAHRGFVQMVNSIWPSLQTVFNDFLDDDFCAGRREVYITGHSLGGGLAIVAGMKLANHYGDALKIHGVTFAAPNVMNEAGVEWYRQRVNNRGVVFDMDPVASSPCGSEYAHGFPRCDGVHHSPFGFDKYHTNPGRVTFDLMEEVGSDKYLNMTSTIGNLGVNVKISGMKLVVTADIAIPPPIQIGISHLCSYACKTSMYCTDKPENGWMCKKCASELKPIKIEMCCQVIGGFDCSQPC